MKGKRTAKEEILEAIKDMTIADVMSMSESLASTAKVEKVQIEGQSEQSADEFEVILSGVGKNKVAVIKAVRGITGLGLKQAKEVVERAPYSVLAGISKDEAEYIRGELQDVGAEAFAAGMPSIRRNRVRPSGRVIVEQEDVSNEYYSSLEWLSNYSKSMQQDVAEEEKKHLEYSSKFDSTLSQIMQLRKGAAQ